MLEHSGARLLFCEDPDQAAKITPVRNRCPDLEHVVLFEGQAQDTISLGELRARGEQTTVHAVDLRLAATDPDDLATIVYTSGTTGDAEGLHAHPRQRPRRRRDVRGAAPPRE